MPNLTDEVIRAGALAAVTKLTAATGGLITRDQLQHGFEIHGTRIPFANRARGIWKPAVLGAQGAALSITTASIPKGGSPRYDDQIASAEGVFRYRYQDRGPDVADNRALRRAMEQKLRLIYFYGVAPGVYRAIAPVFVIGDNRSAEAFEVEVGTEAVDLGASPPAGNVEILKRYATSIVKRRLHQDRFRAAVVRAYQGRCTICRLGHDELIDAAHILPDKDELGKPEIPNGLALCKIHHAAYDSSILGIDPGRVIHVRKDVLEEVDGPMLRHGLQEVDGARIVVPAKEDWKPSPEFLDVRFQRFLAA